MNITGLPEGVEVAEIRPAKQGDVILGGVRRDAGELEICRSTGKHLLFPQLILQPAPGYIFRDAVSKMGQSIIQVIRQFPAPVTASLQVVYRDSEQQAKAAPYLDKLRALGVLA